MRENKFDVALINCGGTASQWRTLNAEGKQGHLELLGAEIIADRLHEDIKRDYKIKTFDFWPGINSSDIVPSRWTELARFLRDTVRNEAKSAVIITGTNTAAYTFSALAFAKVGLPVIGVAGQRHHNRLGSDSQFNIEAGVRTALAAKDQDIDEVMLYSGSRGQEALRAVCSTKLSDNDLRIFGSSNTPPLALITAHDIFFGSHARKSVDNAGPFLPDFADGKVQVIDIVPGLNPRVIEMAADLGTEALVLRSFETGNVPTNLLSPIERLTSRNVWVIVATAFSEPSLSSRMPQEELNAVVAGANTVAGNQSGPSLDAKLGWMLANRKKVKELGGFQAALDHNFVGELPNNNSVLLGHSVI